MELKEVVYTAIKKEYELEEVTDDTVILNESGIDEYSQRNLIMRLEEKLNVIMLDEDIEKLLSVGDLIKYLEGKIK